MADQEQVRHCSLNELRKGIGLPTGRRHVLVIVPLYVRVRLHINPSDARTLDDKFILTGRNTAGTAEDRHTKTVKDDLVPGDRFVDVLYMPIEPELMYSLEVDPGREGEPYLVFERTRGEDLGIPWSPDADRTP